MKRLDYCLKNAVSNVGIFRIKKYMQYLGYSKDIVVYELEAQIYKNFLLLLRKRHSILKKTIDSSFFFARKVYLSYLQKNEKTLRMLRHKQFLPVRGQRTKANSQTQKNKNNHRKVDKGRVFLRKK